LENTDLGEAKYVNIQTHVQREKIFVINVDFRSKTDYFSNINLILPMHTQTVLILFKLNLKARNNKQYTAQKVCSYSGSAGCTGNQGKQNFNQQVWPLLNFRR